MYTHYECICIMQFDFQFFEERKKESNLEQFMQEVDRNSVDWDNFRSRDKLSVEFNSEKPQQTQLNLKQTAEPQIGNFEFDFDNSRNISQISYVGGGSTSHSFKFDQQPPKEEVEYSERYNRIEQLLQKAKTNNLEALYQNLDRAKKVQTREFKDVNEFREFKKELKEKKKERQTEYITIENPFNEHKPTNTKNNEVRNVFKKKSFTNLQFEKTQSFQFIGNKTKEGNTTNNKAPQMNFLPQSFKYDEDQDSQGQMKEEQLQNKLKQYQDDEFFKQGEEFFKPEQKTQTMFAKQFFIGSKNSKTNPIKQSNAPSLQAIRQQCVNVPALNEDPNKITRLLQNYKQIKANFNNLINEVKATTSDKDKLAQELRNLKQQYTTKQQQIDTDLQNEKQKKQERTNKLKQLKQQVQQMRDNGKDLLFNKIQQKIDSLQKLVREAMQEVIEEKKEKITPKVIKYYQEQPAPMNAQLSEHSICQKEPKWTPVQSQWPSRKKEIYSDHPLQNSRSSILSGIDQLRRRNLDLTSPLHLDLSHSQRQQEIENIPTSVFKTQQFAKEYSPSVLQNQNRNLRKCLTQKSAVAFQSFEFHVTAKFGLSEQAQRPVWCEVKVGNKCKLWLSDVFTVVYGPKACDLIMKPAKVLLDRLQPLHSFTFEVGINRQCIEDGGFSVQISYRGDTVGKKKERVNFKIILPILILVKSLPVYEQQFIQAWSALKNQLYVRPKMLNFNHIRTHADLKLLLPLTNISQQDSSCFSYALMFQYPLSQATFFLKIMCFVEGKASLQLRTTSSQYADRKIKEDILDVLNYLCF